VSTFKVSELNYPKFEVMCLSFEVKCSKFEVMCPNFKVMSPNFEIIPFQLPSPYHMIILPVTVADSNLKSCVRGEKKNINRKNCLCRKVMRLIKINKPNRVLTIFIMHDVMGAS